jgi:hypothetical protein
VYNQKTLKIMRGLSKIDHFELEAENMLNYAGSHGEYIGGGDNYAGGYIGEGSYNMSGNDLQSINEADRTMTIQIVNANTSGTANAIIFSAFENSTLTQPSGITVNVLESSHAEVREESKSNPFFVKGMKYIVTDADQFNQNLVMKRKTPSGGLTQYSFQPLQYRSAQNNIATQIDADNFQFEVDGRTTWTFPVLGGVTATLIVTIKTRGDIANILKGQSPVNVARGTTPTGLPQIDLRR